MTRILLLILLVFAVPSARSEHAASSSPRAFVPGSYQKILADHRGKPFILSFWSVSCTHCPAELRALAELKRRFPRLELVVVATDSPEEGAEAARMAREYGLASVPLWIFASEMPERLRFEIDRGWYGELPRTYFFDRNHKVEAVSGLVPEARLQRWAQEQLR